MVCRTETFPLEQIIKAQMVSRTVTSFLGYCALRPVTQYILKKIPDPPSRFFTKLIAWDKKQKKLFVPPNQEDRHVKKMSQHDIRYFLSGVNYIYPDIFSAQDREFILEWYRFKCCFHRINRKPPPPEDISGISDDDGVLWKCSDNLAMNRFRINPNISIKTLVPEPLEDKEKRLVLLKDSKGVIQIYEVSEGIERVLKYFKKPKTLNSYLIASAVNKETVADRYIRIQFAKEKGFIRAVS
jgi:hypothetical protein